MPWVGKTVDRRRNARIAKQLTELHEWNKANPVGTRVRYWMGEIRQGEPTGISKTITEAWRHEFGHLVVSIEGCSGWLPLTHVEPVKEKA